MAARTLLILAVFLFAIKAESRLMPPSMLLSSLPSVLKLGSLGRLASSSTDSSALKAGGAAQAQLAYTVVDHTVKLNLTAPDAGSGFTGSGTWDVEGFIASALGGTLNFDDASLLSGKAAFACQLLAGKVACAFKSGATTIAQVVAIDPFQEPQPGFSGTGSWTRVGGKPA